MTPKVVLRILRVNKSGAISWKDVVVTQDVIFHRILVGNWRENKKKSRNGIDLGLSCTGLTLRDITTCVFGHRKDFSYPF